MELLIQKNDFDFIVRYENSGDLFDISAYYFDGLARTPEVITEITDQGTLLTPLSHDKANSD